MKVFKKARLLLIYFLHCEMAQQCWIQLSGPWGKGRALGLPSEYYGSFADTLFGFLGAVRMGISFGTAFSVFCGVFGWERNSPVFSEVSHPAN